MDAGVTMITTYVTLHQFAYLRESTVQPTDDRITIVAHDDHRWWWVFANLDGIEYVPAPEHRIVDPLSIAVDQKTRDYIGTTHQHRRIRLKAPPVKLLAALEQAKQRQTRLVIKRSWRPVVWIRFKTSWLRFHRWLVKYARKLRRRVL